MKLPEPIRRVSDELAELPSIGPRQAIRLAFYLIARQKDAIHNLAQSIDDLQAIKTCERCFFIHANPDNLCDICRNPNRNQAIIMVVEKETDLISLENTGKYTGRYFIIGEIPKTGMILDWQRTRLNSLKDFITTELVPKTSDPSQPAPQGQADEIILAFNPTSLGNLQATLLIKELSPLAKRMSRLGRGLPTGGEIEFADDETLGASLDRRS